MLITFFIFADLLTRSLLHQVTRRFLSVGFRATEAQNFQVKLDLVETIVFFNKTIRRLIPPLPIPASSQKCGDRPNHDAD